MLNVLRLRNGSRRDFERSEVLSRTLADLLGRFTDEYTFSNSLVKLFADELHNKAPSTDQIYFAIRSTVLRRCLATGPR